ncbi:MAG: sulfatase [Vicinamibacterales bacterium]|jgi:arylsulfatase A-like enzyme|nr:sulfatase [Vicinamibacterales bacterium]MDP6610083.1 sulfatase [Vicinamibacterales bacterium]HAK54741.1 sulfatase [Acidobacteriota bacterium]|tara:strand:- start:3542 stop:5242 length:1701 start_codon:yes stop_codon:yes gene_type:complete
MKTAVRGLGLALVFWTLGLWSCGVQPDNAGNQTLPGDARPHILWLVAEDLGPYIPPFGDTTVATPSLSRLASEGIRYTHVFSPSGVCAPSRAAIATGMYPTAIGAQHMRTGPWYAADPGREALAAYAARLPPGVVPYEAVPPPGVKMHSEYLRRAGYYTSNNAKEDYQFRKPVTAWDDSGPEAHWRNRAPGQPFFAIFNLGVTHESQIWAKADDPMRVDADLDVLIPPYLPDTDIARRDVRRMYSNIVEMDEQVGRILAELEADGLLERTIIFWYADHGGPLPRQKRLLYDSGMRLPLIIRFPTALRAGEIDDQLVSFVDFKPTLLSLAGIELPDYLDGRAFLGDAATTAPRTYVHAAADRLDGHHDTIRAVRDSRFKYLRNLHPERGYYLPLPYREQMPIMQELLRMRDAGELNAMQAQWFRNSKREEELFDTERDPHELNNLAGDPAQASKLAELRAEADRWMTAIDDQGLMDEPAFFESIWPDGVQPVTAPPEGERRGEQMTLQSATDGASIGYQLLDADAEPGATWQVYVEPVTVGPDRTLVAVAHRIGYAPSEAVTFAGAP